MKKIVALVLAMVMVLGLATVAFADTKDYTKDQVTIVTKAGEKVAVTDKVVMTTEWKSTENGKFAAMTPAFYSYNGVDYFVCDPAVATHKLTVAGATVYAVALDFFPVVEKDGAALYTAPKKAMCDKVGAGEAKFVVVDGKYYAQAAFATNTDLALTKDGMVAYDGSAAFLPTTHEVKADSLKYAADGSVASFVCDICGETVNVIPAAKKPAFATNYAEIVIGGEVYAYVVAAAPAGDDATVESPKTFDAGIAMYVGMSVMAAAGSAVVLKKKD